MDEEYKNCNRLAQASVEDAHSKLINAEDQLVKAYSNYQLTLIDPDILQVT